jgi:hypothetical protein
VIGLVVAGLLVAGCAGGTDEPVAAPTPPTTVPPTTPAATTARPAPPPKPTPVRTPPAVTADGECPYADRDTIAGIVGQRIARSTVTSTRPHVGCAFYRANGERAADVTVSVLPDARTALARAIAVPGPAANPVDTVGAGGAVAVTEGGAVLAVAAGRAVVVVRINQRVSLEAVEIARLVVARL